MNSPVSAAAHRDANIHPETGRLNHLWWLVVTGLAVAGAGLVLLSTARYGVGISPDSTIYLEVARDFLSGRAFGYLIEDTLVWSMLWYPPLYGMMLALIGLVTRADPAVFAHLANAVLFGLVIFLSSRLFRTCHRWPRGYALLGVCAVLFSIPLSEVYAMVWSESLFIPLVLLYLLAAQRYWESAGMLSLAVMTLSTALACLTRYIGIPLVAAGAITVVLASGAGLRKRLARAFVFAIASSLPIGLWLLRNYRLTETFFGDRGPTRHSFLHGIVASAKTVLFWFVPGPGPGTKYIVLVCAAIALVALISSRAARMGVLRGLKAVVSDYLPILMVLVSYVVLLSIAGISDAQIESRTLSPVYVPLLALFLGLGSRLLSPAQGRFGAIASRVPMILLALWLCFPLTSVVLSAARRFRDGAGGYSTKTWRESETVMHTQQLLSAGYARLYSNGPDALRALLGASGNQTPRRTAGSIDDLKGIWPAENGAILVWLDNVWWRDYLYSVEELKEIADLDEVAHLSDGAIYRVSRREAGLQEPSRRSDGASERNVPERSLPDDPE